jgi:hypothetical protein
MGHRQARKGLSPQESTPFKHDSDFGLMAVATLVNTVLLPWAREVVRPPALCRAQYCH